MNRLIVTTTVVAAAVALSTGTPAHAATTLRFHDHIVSTSRIHNGVIVKEKATNRATGAAAGHLRVKIAFLSKSKAHFKVKIVLAKGTIYSAYDGNPEQKVTRVAIDRGTGAYKGATGSLKDVNVSDSDDNLTIKLA